MALRGVAWHGVAWRCMALRGVALHGVAWRCPMLPPETHYNAYMGVRFPWCLAGCGVSVRSLASPGVLCVLVSVFLCLPWRYASWCLWCCGVPPGVL